MKPSPARVAARRQAGLLKAPPKMVEEIAAWVVGRVALQLAEPPGYGGVVHPVFVSDDVRALARKDAKSDTKTKATFYVDLKGWPYLRNIGQIKDRAVAMIEPMLDREEVAGTDKIPVPAFLHVLTENSPRYLPIPQIRKMLKEIKADSPSDLAEAALRVLPDGFLSIDVKVDFLHRTTANAIWMPHEHQLTIFPFATMEPELIAGRSPGKAVQHKHRYQALKKQLARSVHHELVHMTQDLLAVFAGLKRGLAGMPSRALRDPRYTPGGVNLKKREEGHPVLDKEYLLKDVEFYTWLRDEVERFLQAAEDNSVPAELWDEARKIWVGAKKGPLINWGTLGRSLPKKIMLGWEPWSVREFFLKLRQNEPKKWRKAVGEFWKATEGKPSPARVAARHARSDGCGSYGLSYAWIDPKGKVHVLSGVRHEGWASEHIRSTPALLKKYKKKYGRDWRDIEYEVEDPWGELLQENGWVRVANFMNVSMLEPTPASLRSLAELMVECALSNRKVDPETPRAVYVEGYGRGRYSLVEAVREFGGSQAEARLFEGLMSRRAAAGFVRKASAKVKFPARITPARLRKIREYAALPDEELYRIDTSDLDEAAFGFQGGSTMEVPLNQITIRFKGDLENAEHRIPDRQTALEWQGALRKPVEIKLKKGKWELQDGHHRYRAAQLLGKRVLLAEVEPDDNPITRIQELAR